MQGDPIKPVAPCEGTGYEIGSMSIVKGARNLDNAKKFYDWALSVDAQKLAAPLRRRLVRIERRSDNNIPLDEPREASFFFGRDGLFPYEPQSHAVPDDHERLARLHDAIGELEQALAKLGEGNRGTHRTDLVCTYVRYPFFSMSANPTPFARSTNPGNDVATFAQSPIVTASDATRPATAKLIATR